MDASLNYLLNMPPPTSTSTPTTTSSAILSNIIANMTTNTIIDENDPIITLPIPSRRLRQPLFHSYIDNNNSNDIDIDNDNDNYNTRRQNYRESLHALNSIFNTRNFLSELNLEDDYYNHSHNHNHNPELIEILNNSLNEPPPYRNVITEKEKSKLKRVKYAEIEEKDISSCPITQEDFKDDDDIIVCLATIILVKKQSFIGWKTRIQFVQFCRHKFESVSKKYRRG